MKIVFWGQLTQQQRHNLLTRPAINANADISTQVANIISLVKNKGDSAIIELTKKFDNIALTAICTDDYKRSKAAKRVDTTTKRAIQLAYTNIKKFHQAQTITNLQVETQPGVLCEQLIRPLDSVGLYIPNGSSPLISTVLMLAIPAQIAGCNNIVLCSPPPIVDAIFYAAELCGITKIYNVGGAQAIAAMAYGTESIAKVDKIFGPGNAFVTEAKRKVSNIVGGVAIDMPAGPSEVLIIADNKADPDFLAADLLSQAEHGPDSQVILVTPDKNIAELTVKAIKKQLSSLSRANIAKVALESSLIIVTNNLNQCITIANDYDPEPLIVQTNNPRQLLASIYNAGSVFLGKWAPESVGDYASGTNHVLPTYGYARTYSSLGLADFTKRMTVQQLTATGLAGIAATVMNLADSEGLDAHKNAVAIRLKKLVQNNNDIGKG